jgi:hypothetical protein
LEACDFGAANAEVVGAEAVNTESKLAARTSDAEVIVQSIGATVTYRETPKVGVWMESSSVVDHGGDVNRRVRRGGNAWLGSENRVYKSRPCRR